MRKNELRKRAEECVRQAQVASNVGDRLMFLAMAQSWLNMADHHDALEALALKTDRKLSAVNRLQ